MNNMLENPQRSADVLDSQRSRVGFFVGFFNLFLENVFGHRESDDLAQALPTRSQSPEKEGKAEQDPQPSIHRRLLSNQIRNLCHKPRLIILSPVSLNRPCPHCRGHGRQFLTLRLGDDVEVMRLLLECPGHSHLRREAGRGDTQEVVVEDLLPVVVQDQLARLFVPLWR